jgi:hypothetical protein
MLIIGKNLQKIKKHVKNKPKVPTKMPISTHEAEYIPMMKLGNHGEVM